MGCCTCNNQQHEITIEEIENLESLELLLKTEDKEFESSFKGIKKTNTLKKSIAANEKIRIKMALNSLEDWINMVIKKTSKVKAKEKEDALKDLKDICLKYFNAKDFDFRDREKNSEFANLVEKFVFIKKNIK